MGFIAKYIYDISPTFLFRWFVWGWTRRGGLLGLSSRPAPWTSWSRPWAREPRSRRRSSTNLSCPQNWPDLPGSGLRWDVPPFSFDYFSFEIPTRLWKVSFAEDFLCKMYVESDHDTVISVIKKPVYQCVVSYINNSIVAIQQHYTFKCINYYYFNVNVIDVKVTWMSTL